MTICMIAAITATEVLKVAKIAQAVGPVFIAVQRVVDEANRAKARKKTEEDRREKGGK